MVIHYYILIGEKLYTDVYFDGWWRHHPTHPSQHAYSKNGLKEGQSFYIYDKLHRTDGPAVGFIDGLSSWDQFWLHGRRHTFEQWIKKVKGKISEERYNYLQERYDR